MTEALRQAQTAFDEDEVPVGAVIVFDNTIIAKSHNQVERLKDPTAHAEMIAITQAANYLNCKWLIDCIMYVTVEPCCMCSGALVLSRIKKIHFGAFDKKTGALGSVFNIANSKILNHNIEIEQGLLEEQCGALMSEFFKTKRK